MKRLLLSAAVLLTLSAPAFATCLSGATPAGTATLKDAAASPNTFTADYTDDGSGNCLPNVVVPSVAGTAVGAQADTAVSGSTSGNGSLIAILKGIYNGIQSLITAVTSSIPSGTNIIGEAGIDQTTDGTTNGVRLTTQYPAGAVAETVTATGTTGATTATLATNTGQTTYICGFSIRANATAAATAEATVTGVITATMDFLQWTAPLASGIGVTEEIFSPCLPASTTNTSIAVVSAAPGSGGTVSVSAWGYLK